MEIGIYTGCYVIHKISYYWKTFSTHVTRCSLLNGLAMVEEEDKQNIKPTISAYQYTAGVEVVFLSLFSTFVLKHNRLNSCAVLPLS